MNKKINIEKKLDFTKEIDEITAISLEHDLSFTNSNNINGNLIVSGRYKTTLAAQFDEEFSYKIPVDISLTDNMDTEKSKVDITDFAYDIVDNKSLLCKIELLIDGMIIEEIDRECDGDPVEIKDLELPKIDDKKEIEDVEVLEEEASNESEVDSDISGEDRSLFNIDTNETYGTFIVYLVGQNETINTILSKYNTTLEEIEKYNDIKDLSAGTKLVIPLLKDHEE